MRLLLIVFLSLSGAKKEAMKRWPNGEVHFKVDQTKKPYTYEMDVTILRREQTIFASTRCRKVTQLFIGKNWQELMERSVYFRSDCSVLEPF